MKSLFGHAERKKGEGERDGEEKKKRDKAEERKEETDDHRKGEGQEKGEEKACDRRRQFIKKKKKHVNLKERLRKRRARGKERAMLEFIQSSQGEKGGEPGERPGLS